MDAPLRMYRKIGRCPILRYADELGCVCLLGSALNIAEYAI